MGWHRSRLGFVTPSIVEVSLGPLDNTHNKGDVLQKRLASSKIELGMKIPAIESRASNIHMTKGITYADIAVRPIKIFVEYVGVNMSIQVPLLVINRRGVSVMST